jgi:hypothetical protein
MTLQRKIRIWLILFVAALVVSGLTAFPLESETRLLSVLLRQSWSPVPHLLPGLADWIDRVSHALTVTYARYPFIAYGTDWLAFAHLAIAVAFIGPLRDPVRNIWVVQFGMIPCAGIIPLALIAGAIRHIPVGWQLIDMSFGVIGIIPLAIVYRLIRQLEQQTISSQLNTAEIAEYASPNSATPSAVVGSEHGAGATVGPACGVMRATAVG